MNFCDWLFRGNENNNHNEYGVNAPHRHALGPRAANVGLVQDS